jgi:hypothetical protein
MAFSYSNGGNAFDGVYIKKIVDTVFAQSTLYANGGHEKIMGLRGTVMWIDAEMSSNLRPYRPRTGTDGGVAFTEKREPLHRLVYDDTIDNNALVNTALQFGYSVSNTSQVNIQDHPDVYGFYLRKLAERAAQDLDIMAMTAVAGQTISYTSSNDPQVHVLNGILTRLDQTGAGTSQKVPGIAAGTITSANVATELNKLIAAAAADEDTRSLAYGNAGQYGSFYVSNDIFNALRGYMRETGQFFFAPNALAGENATNDMLMFDGFWEVRRLQALPQSRMYFMRKSNLALGYENEGELVDVDVVNRRQYSTKEDFTEFRLQFTYGQMLFRPQEVFNYQPL